MPATKVDIFATRYVTASRSAWEDLVELTLSVPEAHFDSVAESLSKHIGTTKNNLRRKMNAIHYAHSLANSAEDIKKAGQEATLSRFIKKTNADNYEETAVISWKLPGSLREVIRKDVTAVAKILNFQTSEQFFDFLHSLLVDLTNDPDSLKHLAGQLEAPKT